MAAKAKGLNLEQAVEQIELPQFNHLGMYDQWFKMNVEGMYRQTPPENEGRPEGE